MTNGPWKEGEKWRSLCCSGVVLVHRISDDNNSRRVRRGIYTVVPRCVLIKGGRLRQECGPSNLHWTFWFVSRWWTSKWVQSHGICLYLIVQRCVLLFCCFVLVPFAGETINSYLVSCGRLFLTVTKKLPGTSSLFTTWRIEYRKTGKA